MVKKEGVVYPCLYHSIALEGATNNDAFSGRIIITTINGQFINGYQVAEGVFISQYKVKNKKIYPKVFLLKISLPQTMIAKIMELVFVTKN